jgi:hypothetical protein
MLKRFGICVGLILLIPFNASAVYLTDLNRSYEASGGSAPPIGNTGDVVIDGDFRVRNWGNNVGPVGDGIDDETTWVFHFAENHKERVLFEAFETDLRSPGGKLVGVDVWLQFIPKSTLFTTDEFQLIGLGTINLSKADGYDDLSVGKMGSVHFDLLDFFSENVLACYIVDHRGIFGASFRDDAIMSVAKMDMKTVPEPTSLALLGAGLFGLIGMRMRT